MVAAAERRLTPEQLRHPLGAPAAQFVLGLVLALGSLALWLGIPAGWLLLFSRIETDYLKIYFGTLAAARRR
jgi:protein-S-isoprenylcysteine O-methyltransferase Ste14